MLIDKIWHSTASLLTRLCYNMFGPSLVRLQIFKGTATQVIMEQVEEFWDERCAYGRSFGRT
jgi:hypothetical protein